MSFHNDVTKRALQCIIVDLRKKNTSYKVLLSLTKRQRKLGHNMYV